MLAIGDRNSITADPRGAAPMPGFDLLEKLAGAHDTLTVTHEITKYQRSRRMARRPRPSATSPILREYAPGAPAAKIAMRRKS